ncbi:hypothetical protein DY000_02006791 [Brassica cretica]|uniref:F-box domain-containing protein n=1 Tax=Brassica cretica TaxID=69181 RepID=A0ABQ7CLI5_BRACR|nr:hypothetical protein DY000_02006791 [Brassica cretica]
MEGSPYRKFSFSRRKGAVPGTGPGVLRSGDPGCLLAGTQRPAVGRVSVARVLCNKRFCPMSFVGFLFGPTVLEDLIKVSVCSRLFFEYFKGLHLVAFFRHRMHIDLGRGVSGIVNLRFHRSDFCNRLYEVIAKIADLGFLVSRFPTLSTFSASVPSLLLGQFFLFVPEDSFFFFGHRIIELGIILSRLEPHCSLHDADARVISSGFFPDVFPCALPDRSEGFGKSSLLPRIQVVPRGRTALVVVVRFSTCLARELMTFSRSSDFFLKGENIFWTSSNAAVLSVNHGNIRCWSVFNVFVDGIAVASLLVVEIVS